MTNSSGTEKPTKSALNPQERGVRFSSKLRSRSGERSGAKGKGGGVRLRNPCVP